MDELYRELNRLLEVDNDEGGLLAWAKVEHRICVIDC